MSTKNNSLLPPRTIAGTLIRSDANVLKADGTEREMFDVNIRIAEGTLTSPKGNEFSGTEELSVTVYKNSGGNSFDELKTAPIGAKVEVQASERTGKAMVRTGGKKKDGSYFESLKSVPLYTALPGAKIVSVPAKA